MHDRPEIRGIKRNEYSDIPKSRVHTLDRYRNKRGALCSYFSGWARSRKDPSATLRARLRLSRNSDRFEK
ncbi:MAG: hypothetical protein AAGA77_11910 [Bacteroidota bacterium]